MAWSIRVVGRGCLAFEDGDVVDSAMVSLGWKIGMGRDSERRQRSHKSFVENLFWTVSNRNMGPDMQTSGLRAWGLGLRA